MPLCFVCNIFSHVYVNHEAYGTTMALVNICARYNNPLLLNLLRNAKCPNRSERQQKQETFATAMPLRQTFLCRIDV